MKLRRGFTSVENSISQNPNLSQGARLVYEAIKSYFNKRFPSYSSLCKTLCMGRSRLSRSIRELVERKLLVYEKGNSRKRANQYTLLDINLADLTTHYRMLKSWLKSVLVRTGLSKLTGTVQAPKPVPFEHGKPVPFEHSNNIKSEKLKKNMVEKEANGLLGAIAIREREKKLLNEVKTTDNTGFLPSKIPSTNLSLLNQQTFFADLLKSI